MHTKIPTTIPKPIHPHTETHPQSQTYTLKLLKKTLWSLLLYGVQLSQVSRATTKGLFTFYH